MIQFSADGSILATSMAPRSGRLLHGTCRRDVLLGSDAVGSSNDRMGRCCHVSLPVRWLGAGYRGAVSYSHRALQ